MHAQKNSRMFLKKRELRAYFSQRKVNAFSGKGRQERDGMEGGNTMSRTQYHAGNEGGVLYELKCYAVKEGARPLPLCRRGHKKRLLSVSPEALWEIPGTL